MENDPPNAELSISIYWQTDFGIHFDDVLHHHIIGEQVEDGRIPVAAEGPLFHHSHTLYMKDTCAILLSGTAARCCAIEGMLSWRPRSTDGARYLPPLIRGSITNTLTGEKIAHLQSVR